MRAADAGAAAAASGFGASRRRTRNGCSMSGGGGSARAADREQLPQCRICIGIAERREVDTRDGAVRADPRAHDDRGRRRGGARVQHVRLEIAVQPIARITAPSATATIASAISTSISVNPRCGARAVRDPPRAWRLQSVLSSHMTCILVDGSSSGVRRADRGTQPHRRRDGRRAQTSSAAYGTHVSNGTDHLARAARTDRHPGAPHPLSRDGHGTTRPGGRANGWKTGSDRKKHPAAGGER